jgi:anaerobic ribonucleoside-triphosphate reductase activating protein
MLIHAILAASGVNGPGLRAVLFLQGCRLACDSCWNPRSHAFVGHEIPIAEVVDRLLGHISEERLDGVTFSGGEPMQQAHELAGLLEQLRTAAPEISIGMFSGYSLAELDSGRFWTRGGGDRNERIGLWRSIQSRVDFGVMGRYNRRQPSTDPLCTSKNQKLLLFTARHSEAEFGEQAVEVTISADGLTRITGFPTLGIPA